ncbi:MAG TPA: sn-glycerol-3-phosphate ABC transporter ATP-binding protein UgpC [Acidisoma sp.]|uniref:ABC transporter ATP-binding protein n=1 Tax=Acidisoma sp. TaxID=1872115 RepID=UPI002BE6145A|nr:sn-glycerol-3-phosphate ABC transporter ATP-binding protein UgpC [Acidisoma sp.]HTI00751.1 sn-glycerol-3-phosphate ABC transporter ATP-binding protein UgpC [Acidisoma sp.]
MADIRIRGLRKSFGGMEIVHGIDLDVRNGEFLVVLGPSGCGKSTLLRLIAGLEEISDGEIAIGGRIVNRLEPRERGCAMVFQNYALYPHMSVYDNMAFGLKLRKFPKEDIRRRVEEAARILHLTPLLQRKPRALSGGQRQRVAMGRAIVRNPKVFLFDEPLSNLDAKLRVQMRTEIKKVHNTVKTTTVYVTHDQVEAMTLADRVVVMNQGLIEQVGPPQELYHHPETRFVAGFIGSPGMNFIPCKLVKMGDGLSVNLENGVSLAVPAERFSRYAPYAGKDMLFGIRPEHLPVDTGDNRPGFATMPVDIDITEPMGMETVIYFFLGSDKSEHKDVMEAPFCARIDPLVPVRQGTRVQLSVDMNNMHLIDPSTDKVV